MNWHLQVLTCTPVPSQALQSHVPAKPLGLAATQRPASCTDVTDDTPTAAVSAPSVMPQADSSHREDEQRADTHDAKHAQQAQHAQAGVKRKRADSAADVDMHDADVDQSQHAQHAKQQYPDSVQAANPSSSAGKSAPAHATQPLDQPVKHEPQTDTPQADSMEVDEGSPETKAVQQSQSHPVRPSGHPEGVGQGQHLGVTTSWGDKLGRVVQWCWGYIVKEHLVTELQVSLPHHHNPHLRCCCGAQALSAVFLWCTVATCGVPVVHSPHLQGYFDAQCVQAA